MINFKNLKKVYTIAEIGINHNGDIDLAKKLIDAAYVTGWDCVKFQKRVPDICVPEEQKNKLRQTPWGEMKYIDYKHKIEFKKNAYDLIDQYCKSKPIDWTASVWDMPSLDFILDYEIPFIKIPSAHLTNLELVERAAETKKPIIISTGMSTLEEVDNAYNIIIKHNSNLVIMHCNSTYPAPIEELNLKVIKTFNKRYGSIIGYSGHEYSLEPTVIAAVLGAKVIERHITIDHNLWGTDQKSSLEIDGMDKLIKRLSIIDSIIGNGEKKLSSSELDVRSRLRGN
ncbi:MAG: N-acetylneuraminate synthase [Flavobacteriaceae bacterium TMED238]|nr:MAG: N-acetylneuraminate synthase [Flavobacteriaceae bacterium TMED238]